VNAPCKLDLSKSSGSIVGKPIPLRFVGGHMSRQVRITKRISKDELGIEIGPWCNPLTPKSGGYRCLVVDVFNTGELRRRAADDLTLTPEMAARIEDVDLVGSSAQIAELVENAGLSGKLDYVVSSHNFEHIPDPVRFLQGCAAVLRPGGVLSMAIPDRRGCFDYYRPVATLADMLDAYFSKRIRPSDAQIFEQASYHARKIVDGEPVLGFSSRTSPLEIIPYETLDEAYERWSKRVSEGREEYFDAHCWAFTPSSFELAIGDLAHLGLCTMQLDEVDREDGEFYVHLTNVPDARHTIPSKKFYERRAHLLRQSLDESTGRSEPSDVSDVPDALAETARQVEALTHELAVERERNEQAQHKLTSELAQAREHAEQLQRALSEMTDSTSWRLTSPLRALRTVVRRPETS
jgi:SAM-dependent methyltransferase